ncbi:MAG: alpha/beta hydrolase [Actinomycetes bacterium]
MPTTPLVPSHWHRTVRLVAGGAAVLTPAAVAAVYAAARVLTDAPRHRPPRAALRGRFHDAGEVAAVPVVDLAGTGAASAGRWGLWFDGGYAQTGDPVAWPADGVRRPYDLLDGAAPTAAAQLERRRGDRRDRRSELPAGTPDRADGDRPDAAGTTAPPERRRRSDRRRRREPPPWPVKVALHPYAFPDDPQLLAARHGARFELDVVRTPAMDLPAWRFVPAEPTTTTWLVGVHGRGARRTELFRILDTALEAGVPCLVTSYRTDPWVSSPQPVTTLGHTEWVDVEAAVARAVAAGADRVVLAGCSLGGGIVATTLRRSALRDAVAGVVLDSPALDWGPVLAHIARRRRLPTPLVPLVLLGAQVRSRIDFSALDHVSAAPDFQTPILLFHGSEDPIVPVWLSDAFARARPDLVTYVRVEGAGHVRAWNTDPLRYRWALTRFLRHTCTPAPDVARSHATP